jgi:hypothetical protein
MIPGASRACRCAFGTRHPGETIRTEMWTDGGEVGFRARVLERDVVAPNNGLARWPPEPEEPKPGAAGAPPHQGC